MTESVPAAVSDKMRAIAIREPGGPEVLTPVEVSMPVCGAEQVLIKVAAAGVNRPDVVQRLGFYPAPPGASELPGLEVAGEVVACGEQVAGLQVGDQVCALVTGGGYAEYCVAMASACLPIPMGLSFIEAAAIPETFFTVWHNVFERGALKAGERFLVHGGTSGIGSAAIQLAKAMGAEVFATAGSAEKCAACSKLGADHAINYREQDFVEVIQQATEGSGVDVILDMVGGDYVQRNITVAAEDGRLVSIAHLQGWKMELNIMPIMLKRLTLTGSTLRARPDAVKAGIAAALRQQVWPLLESGEVKPVIDSTFALAGAAKAHQRMESGAHVGNIVLVVD